MYNETLTVEIISYWLFCHNDPLMSCYRMVAYFKGFLFLNISKKPSSAFRKGILTSTHMIKLSLHCGHVC